MRSESIEKPSRTHIAYTPANKLRRLNCTKEIVPCGEIVYREQVEIGWR